MRGIVLHSWIATTLVVAMSTPVFATPVSDQSTIVIPVGAADFATEAATERLIKKVRLAAHTVCKEEFSDDDGDLFTRECELSAMDDGLAQIQVDKAHAAELATVSAASIVIVVR